MADSQSMSTGNVKGNPSATVEVVEWADFQCPYCREFALGPGRQLSETLIASGQVKLIWHNFAFLGPESVWAAEAAECACDQGRFWDYHDRLFEEQRGENQGSFDKANLKRFAAALGLDPSAFDGCLDSACYAEQIAAVREQGIQQGVRMTPTLFVNGRKFEGVPSFDQLVQLIQTT